MIRPIRQILHATAACLVVTATARAQSTSPAGCEDAAIRISTGGIPRVGAPQWNDWMTLTGCGNRGAAAVAGALRSDAVRTETELTRLDHLASVLDGWFQPSLVAAYQSLLRTPDASWAVRLRAMWLLGGLYAPATDVAGPLQGFMASRGCDRYERVTALREAPGTLPPMAFDQVRDAMSAAANDGYAPEYVRTTARCWEGVIQDAAVMTDRGVRDERVVVDAPPPPPTTVVIEPPVRVVYDCDNRYVFYNEAGYDLAVRYAGYGAGVLRVAHGGPFVWMAARFGPMQFWVGDSPIVYTSAMYRPCGGRRIVVGPVIYPWYGWRAGLGVYVGPRYVVPRYGPPPRYVVPRPNHPVMVVPPRRGRDDDDWDRRVPRGRPEGRDGDDHRTYGDRGVAVPRGGPPAPSGAAPPSAPPSKPGPKGDAPRGGDRREERFAEPKKHEGRNPGRPEFRTP